MQKSDFHIVKVIGRGSFGKVYLVKHNILGQYYAMKSVKKELVLKTDQLDGIRSKLPSKPNLSTVEREILEKFDHPFIMKL